MAYLLDFRSDVLLLPENVRLLPTAAGQLSYPYWEMSDYQELEKDKCPTMIFS